MKSELLRLAVRFFILTLQFLYVLTESDKVHLTDEKKFFIWSPKENGSVTVTADDGYQITVTTENCTIDGADGEYATLSTAEEDTKNELRFTYTVKKKQQYFYNQNHVYASVNFAGHNSTITFNFTRIGERTVTTTSIPFTTEIPSPTPANDSGSITVHVSGVTLKEFRTAATQVLFKEILIKMAKVYCNEHNIHPKTPITRSNILITRSTSCPPSWTMCTPCVTFTFAIPLELKDQTIWMGYELSAEHLKSMWYTYARHYLNDGLDVCDPPPIESIVVWQLVAFSGVTVIFVAALLIIRSFTSKYSKMTAKETATWESRRISSRETFVEDLRPHPLQETPQMFEDATEDNVCSIKDDGNGEVNGSYV